jgi:DNA-binding cell septation regulator SpoVG
MQISNHRQVDRGNIIAEFSLLLDNGLELRGFLHMRSGNGEFVSMPSRKYQDRDGNDKYFNYVAIPDNDIYRRFQNKCLELLRAYKPTPAPAKEATPTDDIPF